MPRAEKHQHRTNTTTFISTHAHSFSSQLAGPRCWNSTDQTLNYWDSTFYRPDELCCVTQPTASKHWQKYSSNNQTSASLNKHSTSTIVTFLFNQLSLRQYLVSTSSSSRHTMAICWTVTRHLGPCHNQSLHIIWSFCELLFLKFQPGMTDR